MISLLLYTLWAHGLGLAVLGLLGPKQGLSRLLRHSLAGPTGFLALFWMGLLMQLTGLTLGLLPALISSGLLIVLNLWLQRTQGNAPPLPTSSGHGPLRWFEWALITAIAIQVIYILFEAAWRPVALDDDWSQWARNAKLLFHHGTASTAFFREGHQTYYPQFIMVNEVFFSRLLGHWDDFLCKSFLTALFFYFTAFCSIWILEQYRSRPLALLGAFFVLTVPTYVRVGLDGTAELPISFYMGMAGGMAVLADRSRNPRLYWLAGLMAAGVAGIKSEGFFAIIALLGAWSLLTLLRRRALWRPLL
ncbi:MAG: hypothetical protein ACYTGH_14060, partial [Planctomycetota bacterium]